MPDLSTLKITYLSETPFKIVNFLIIASLVVVAIYEIVRMIKPFKNKDKDCNPYISPMFEILVVYTVFFFYFLFVFEVPYADVSVKVIPNMDVREFDMNYSRDFFKKRDDYYFIKTIKTCLFEKCRAEQGEEGLSDIIRWNIKNSVSGTREEDK